MAEAQFWLANENVIDYLKIDELELVKFYECLILKLKFEKERWQRLEGAT